MAKPLKIDIGIAKKDREVIADGLSRLLADSYTLYLQSHNFHWNVTGPMFQTLHVLFMEHYTEQWTALDLDRRAHPVARACRRRARTRSSSRLASIKEVEGTPAPRR